MAKRTAFIAFCLLVVIAHAARAGAESKWLLVSTPNFVVYCDTSEDQAREIAERLEGFRTLVTSVFPRRFPASNATPVPVVAFGGDGAFRPFKPLRNGKPSDAAGVFLRGTEQSVIALDVSRWESSSHIILHEYIHHLNAATGRTVPLWFDEGLAELFSTARPGTTAGQIGKVVPGYMQMLQERALMPLDALFAVGHDSPEYSEEDRDRIFYAESWAFVHFCILDPQQKRSSQLTDFVAREENGEPVASAFQTAFGTDMATMQNALEAYVRQSAVTVFDVTFTTPVKIPEASAGPAPAVEIEYYLGSVLALEQRFDEAEPHFRRGMELDATSPLPHEAMGFVAYRKGDLAAAKSSFAAAAERGSKNYLALYNLAAIAMGSPGGATAPATRSVLERAVALNPNYAPTYFLLTELALHDDDAKAAAGWAERGLDLDPRNGRLRVDLARAQISEDRFDDTRAGLRRVVETSDDESVRTYAKGLLETVEKLVAAHAASATPPHDSAQAEPAGPPIVLQAAGLGEGYVKAADGEVYGVVTRFECDAKRVTVRVRVGGSELAFTSESPATLVLATLVLDSHARETITCGTPLEREAYVQFDPVKQGTADGVLKAVVFAHPADKKD
jgi:tetratricopeptide (TPR) repeat protein